jgi:hypothetical protein
MAESFDSSERTAFSTIGCLSDASVDIFTENSVRADVELGKR